MAHPAHPGTTGLLSVYEALIFHRMQQKVDMKTKKRVEQVDKLQKKLEDLRTAEVNELWENIIQKKFEVDKIFVSILRRNY